MRRSSLAESTIIWRWMVATYLICEQNGGCSAFVIHRAVDFQPRTIQYLLLQR